MKANKLSPKVTKLEDVLCLPFGWVIRPCPSRILKFLNPFANLFDCWGEELFI